MGNTSVVMFGPFRAKYSCPYSNKRIDNYPETVFLHCTSHFGTQFLFYVHLTFLLCWLHQNFLGAKLSTNGAALVDAIDTLSAATKAELQGKYSVVSRAVKEELSDLAKLLDQEMADVSRELTKAQRQLRRMYNRNAFHLKEMGEVVESTYQKV